MEESDDFSREYLAKLSALLAECMDEGSAKHGVLLVADALTDVISVYTVNTPEEVLPVLLRTAQQVLDAPEIQTKNRTVN